MSLTLLVPARDLLSHELKTVMSEFVVPTPCSRLQHDRLPAQAMKFLSIIQGNQVEGVSVEKIGCWSPGMPQTGGIVKKSGLHPQDDLL